MNKKIKKFLIKNNRTAEQALKVIDKNGSKTCFIVDNNNKLVGSLTDGDIRRSLYKKKKTIGQKLNNFLNKKYKFIKEKEKLDYHKIRKILVEERIEAIPVVDEENKVIDVIINSKKYFLRKKKGPDKTLSNIKVVIMAGGKGERLDPITRVLPKPLVPLKDKTVIENIMDSFLKRGAKKFFLLLNFKSDLIKAYFSSKKNINSKINYVNEVKPLGTAGGLEKLKKNITNNFIVSNCDVVFDFDYKKLINYHTNKKNDLTLVVSNQTSVIPYGVCKIDKNNNLNRIDEKPRYKHLITTGLYVFSKKILNNIPKNKFLDMNTFIEILIKKEKKIGIFKISQNNWYDIGQLREYKKRLDSLDV